MSRRDAAERLRRHLHAAADALVELVLRDAPAGADNDDGAARPPRRRTTAATILEASETDKAFAEKVLRAGGVKGRGGR